MSNKNIYIAGPCVIESQELLNTVAEELVRLNKKYGIDIIFKASFDKANRTSLKSFRGPGITKGLAMLQEIKNKYGLRLLTDIHESNQAEAEKKLKEAEEKLAKAGLLKDTKFTGGIWQNFFDYFEFLPRENFQPKLVVQDKQIITAIGFAHQEFARRVILSLGLAENTDNYFKEQNDYAEEDLIFTLSDQDFDQVKRSIENSLCSILVLFFKIVVRILCQA